VETTDRNQAIIAGKTNLMCIFEQVNNKTVFCLSHATICLEIVILMAISSLKNES
jgi:hypothetical protein